MLYFKKSIALAGWRGSWVWKHGDHLSSLGWWLQGPRTTQWSWRLVVRFGTLFGGRTDKMEWKLQGVKDRIESFRDCSWIWLGLHTWGVIYQGETKPTPLYCHDLSRGNPESCASESCSVLSSSLRPHGYSPRNSLSQNTALGRLSFSRRSCQA